MNAEPTQDKWAMETMMMINKLTPEDVNKEADANYNLGRRHGRNEVQIELEAFENWAKGICRDFKIDYDDHPAGLRLAINRYMIDRGGPR